MQRFKHKSSILTHKSNTDLQPPQMKRILIEGKGVVAVGMGWAGNEFRVVIWLGGQIWQPWRVSTIMTVFILFVFMLNTKMKIINWVLILSHH